MAVNSDASLFFDVSTDTVPDVPHDDVFHSGLPDSGHQQDAAILFVPVQNIQGHNKYYHGRTCDKY